MPLERQSGEFRYTRRGLAELNRTVAASPMLPEALATHVRRVGNVCHNDLPNRSCLLTKSLLELGEGAARAREHVERLRDGTERRYCQVPTGARDQGELPADVDQLPCRLRPQLIGLRAYAQRSLDERLIQQVAEDVARDIEAMAVPLPGDSLIRAPTSTAIRRPSRSRTRLPSLG